MPLQPFIHVKYVNDDLCDHYTPSANIYTPPKYIKYASFAEIPNPNEVVYINCIRGKLTHLPENMAELFPLLRELYCSENNLTHLPANMHFPNLQHLYCDHNQLVALPDTVYLPRLLIFICNDNYLSELPLWLLKCEYLQGVLYKNNPGMIITPQIRNFIEHRIMGGSITQLNVYEFKWNVFTASIKNGVDSSIARLMEHMPPVICAIHSSTNTTSTSTIDSLIANDTNFPSQTKQQLMDYCKDTTFANVLYAVLYTIAHDFADTPEIQAEIKRILVSEMNDAADKCFQGRISRLVNCLSGFSPLVHIGISETEQIANIIVMLRRTTTHTKNKTFKQIVSDELHVRGFNSDTIAEWIEYIDS